MTWCGGRKAASAARCHEHLPLDVSSNHPAHPQSDLGVGTLALQKMNSRQKGKRVERQWRDQLREAGFLKAFRGQQYCGATGNADVVCPELPWAHFEVKGVQNLNVLNAVKQAINDCGNKTPVVAHKKNGEPWLVTMLAADWLELVKESDRVVSPDLPSVACAATESVPSPACNDCAQTDPALLPSDTEHFRSVGNT